MRSLIQITIALILTVVIIVNVDWHDFFVLMYNISLPYIILLLLISFIMILISCIKWQLFLSERDINVSLLRLVFLYVVGYFFNNFLPTNVGGDLARGFVLGREIRSQSESFGSVFLERFTGSIALSILAVISMTVNHRLMQRHEILLSFTAYCFFLAIIISLFISKKSYLFLSLFENYQHTKLFASKIKPLFDAIHYFSDQIGILSKAMLLSLIFHIFTILNTLVVCLSLRLHVSFFDIAVVVPIILVISMVPISINSIGIWEGSFIYFFSLVGVPPSAALSVALILRAKNLLLALIGGLLFATWNRLPGRAPSRGNV